MIKDKMCQYCGKRPAKKSILNPNNPPDIIIDTYWDVCESCNDIIKAQQNLSMAAVIKHLAEKSGDDVQKKIADKIYDTAEDNIKKMLKEVK